MLLADLGAEVIGTGRARRSDDVAPASPRVSGAVVAGSTWICGIRAGDVVLPNASSPMTCVK
jgi:hypothetical protein